MSFLTITDPMKRDLIVGEFLKTKKNIQRNQLAERVGEKDAIWLNSLDNLNRLQTFRNMWHNIF